jgi:thiol:disulfide interchange protein
MSYLILLLLNLITPTINAYDIQVNTRPKDQNTQLISVDFKLEPQELLYKNSLQATVNNPDIVLTDPITQTEASLNFDQVSKETKESYKNNVTFTFEASNAIIHTYFNINTNKQPQEKLININFSDTSARNEAKASSQSFQATTYTPEQRVSCYMTQPSLMGSFIQSTTDYITKITHQWKSALSSIFESTGSGWLRLLVALILGILLSMTPCIYPMIPITVGILQSSESKSLARNFLVALSYTFGISCTFALLGFITALGSCVFGQLQSSAWLVLPLILILFYLGLAMFGFYEMYIPKFLQPKSVKIKGGSFISAFIFGAVSGTVASPCLSPGLALILAHVAKVTEQATIFNYIDGFTTLFVFGIGSSLPLLIIGTFSKSLNFLPKAGTWMIEIKRLLGLMLIGMAFYHLEKFISWSILIWIITSALFALGVYYFQDVKSYDSRAAKRYKNIVGTLLIIFACLAAVQGYKSMYTSVQVQEQVNFWLTDYDAARELAKKENKKLLIDFKTKYCPACTALDKRVFSNPQVIESIKKYIPVKIDATDTSSQPFARLQQPLEIKGFPTVVIIDADTEKAVKKWLGDVGTISEFLQELETHK